MQKKGEDVVWEDIIALAAVNTRMRTKTAVKKLQLEKGTKLCLGGRATCRFRLELRKSDSLLSCCKFAKNEVSVSEKVNENMGRGGIYIVTDEWTYNVPTDLPYYYSRVCTKPDYVLWMNKGDVIDSSLLGEVVFYIGWKEPEELHSSFQTGWQSSSWTAPADAYYVFQARYATERELTDDEVSEIIASFRVIRMKKNLEERVEVLENFSPKEEVVAAYYGERLPLNSIYVQHISDIVMDGTNEAVNGLAIDGNTLITLYNSGIARLYEITKDFDISNPSELFELGSHAANNHSNCGSFGNKYDVGDALPLLYVSQYHSDGKKMLC